MDNDLGDEKQKKIQTEKKNSIYHRFEITRLVIPADLMSNTLNIKHIYKQFMHYRL